MEKVLITGASGFIGRAITTVAAMEKDWDIYGVVSGRRTVTPPPPPPPHTPNVHIITTDLQDENQCKALMEKLRPDIMLHLAWNLEKRDFLCSLANIQWLEISLRLLRVFHECGGKQFVFAGSSAEYGYEHELCSENDDAHPCDLYGVCKLAFTNLAASFCAANDISFASIRYFSIYGPGEGHILHAIPTAIHTMLQGETFICKAPNNVWDYVYIEDAAEATFRIMRSKFCGIVNVGGSAVSMRELFTMLAELTGNKGTLVLENETSVGQRLVADTRILQEKIGYSCRTDLRQGLSKTVQWWKNEQKEGRL